MDTITKMANDLPDVSSEHQHIDRFVPHIIHVSRSNPWRNDDIRVTTSHPRESHEKNLRSDLRNDRWVDIRYIENCNSVPELRRIIRTQQRILMSEWDPITGIATVTRHGELILSAKKRLQTLGHHGNVVTYNNEYVCAELRVAW